MLEKDVLGGRDSISNYSSQIKYSREDIRRLRVYMVDILRSGKLLGQSSDEVRVNNVEIGQQHSNVNIIPVEPEERSEGIEKLQVLVTDFSKGRKKPTRPHLPLDGLDVHEKPNNL